MNRLTILTAFLLLAGNVMAAGNDDAMFERGKELTEKHCTRCHDDSVYTREDRLVKSLDALSRQVKMCKNNTGVALSDDDTGAVVHFLNEQYYRF